MKKIALIRFPITLPIMPKKRFRRPVRRAKIDDSIDSGTSLANRLRSGIEMSALKTTASKRLWIAKNHCGDKPRKIPLVKKTSPTVVKQKTTSATVKGRLIACFLRQLMKIIAPINTPNH